MHAQLRPQGRERESVDFTNRVVNKIMRPVNLVHMPVPRERSDDAYFAPLQNLRLPPETELCLGLVHYTDGIEGAKKRLATARKYVQTPVGDDMPPGSHRAH